MRLSPGRRRWRVVDPVRGLRPRRRRPGARAPRAEHRHRPEPARRGDRPVHARLAEVERGVPEERRRGVRVEGRGEHGRAGEYWWSAEGGGAELLAVLLGSEVHVGEPGAGAAGEGVGVSPGGEGVPAAAGSAAEPAAGL